MKRDMWGKKLGIICITLLYLTGCADDRAQDEVQDSIVDIATDNDTDSKKEDVDDSTKETVENIEEVTTEDTTEELSGMCGSNLTWILTEEGILTIQGEGDMDLSPDWEEYKSDIKSVILEEGVTSIGDSAFAECENLVTVTISESVSSISEYAFEGCDNLREIVIPAGVTYMGQGVFRNCINLENIVIEEGNASFTVEDGVLFSGDMTALYEYPAGKSESSYALPDSVVMVAPYAFASCQNLTDVIISEGVTEIGSGAFENSSDDLTIYVTKLTSSPIGWNQDAFSNEQNMIWGIVDSGTCGEHLIWILNGDGVLNIRGYGSMTDYDVEYDDENSMSIMTVYKSTSPWFNREDILKVLVDEGVTSIGDGAFIRCSRLSEVTFADSIVRIGKHSFDMTTALSSISLPKALKKIDEYAFGNGVVKNIEFQGQLESIERGAFLCCQLQGVVLPESLLRIGDYAFVDALSEGYIVVPEQVLEIGENAFGCDNVITIEDSYASQYVQNQSDLNYVVMTKDDYQKFFTSPEMTEVLALYEETFEDYKAYMTELASSYEKNAIEQFFCRFLYIDEDDIPELICCVKWGSLMPSYYTTTNSEWICTYYDGALYINDLNELDIDVYASSNYVEYENRVNIFGGRMGYYSNEIYSLIDGIWTKVAGGNYCTYETDEQYGYTWNGEDVSEEEYNEQLQLLFPEDQTVCYDYEYDLEDEYYSTVSLAFLGLLSE